MIGFLVIVYLAFVFGCMIWETFFPASRILYRDSDYDL